MTDESSLIAVLNTEAEKPLSGQTIVPAQGSICPSCGLGILDYDGLLNLSCPVCQFHESGCFT